MMYTVFSIWYRIYHTSLSVITKHMRCPKCKNAESKVLDSRMTEDGNSIRRRRECEKCNYRFTTFERLENTDLIVMKRDGTREPYSRQKLENGVWRACTKRPVAQSDIDKMIQDLESKWVQDKEISSDTIGTDVMNSLREIDEIAYIRFASVYEDFEDINQFKKIVEEMK